MRTVDHVEGVHDMVDFIGQQFVQTGENRDEKNVELADRCIEDMRRQEFTDSMIREVAHHTQGTVGTRIKIKFPDIFASGDDISFVHSGLNPRSHTEV